MLQHNFHPYSPPASPPLLSFSHKTIAHLVIHPIHPDPAPAATFVSSQPSFYPSRPLNSDPKEGNWWMQFRSDYIIGYWPSFLFSYLSESASMVEWEGEVVNSEPDGRHTAMEMGIEHFPEEGFGKASYFRNVQIVDESNNLRSPEGIGVFTEQSNCYDVQRGSNGDWGTYFYFGGPEKSPNCY
ncbi:hypothetical protein KSP39_PZI009689 [Platanthera zijinensis]|uniref:Neprosin PEP catalytic domain-containing protein n=1 Tax=Platanthera zijinensis TaxID=2320716 RepID=A0AAP0BL39_9ASPA